MLAIHGGVLRNRKKTLPGFLWPSMLPDRPKKKVELLEECSGSCTTEGTSTSVAQRFHEYTTPAGRGAGKKAYKYYNYQMGFFIIA